MSVPQKRDEPQYRQLAVVYVVAYIILFTGVCLGIVGRMPHTHAPHSSTFAANPAANEISRTDPVYWLTGNGAWLSRWSGTGKDTWLAIASIAATLWLLYEYWQYAQNCGNVSKQLHRGTARRHVLQLRRVFMQSMLIHACTGVLVWWVPAFWVITGLMIANAWQIRQLNTAKIHVLQSHKVATVADVTTATLAFTDTTRPDVHEKLDQAKILLMQRVPDAVS